MNKERKGSVESKISNENQISGTFASRSTYSRTNPPQQTWAQSIMNPPTLTKNYRPIVGKDTKSSDIYKIGSNIPLNQNVIGDEIKNNTNGSNSNIDTNGSRYMILSGIPSLEHVPTPRHSRSDMERTMTREVENIPTPRPSRIFNENQYQENRGKRWSSEEDMYLLQQVSFLSHLDIGRHLRRSENAVVSRLKKLAFHMIQNGEDLDVVQNNLHLSNEDIQQISNECFIYPKKTNGKFIITSKKTMKKGYFAPQQSQEIQLLLEIKTMLRKILYLSYEQHGMSRSPKQDMDRSQAAIRISDLNIEDLEKRSEEFAKSNI